MTALATSHDPIKSNRRQVVPNAHVKSVFVDNHSPVTKGALNIVNKSNSKKSISTINGIASHPTPQSKPPVQFSPSKLDTTRVKSATANPKLNGLPISSNPLTKSSKINGMHLTALGAHLLSSSVHPVAAVEPPHDAVLTTVKDVLTEGSTDATPVQQEVAVPVITIADSTAPRDQGHAQVWSTAIEAAKTGQGLLIGGEELKEPALASVDANGSMVKVALSDVTNAAPGDAIDVTKTAAGPVVSDQNSIVANLVAHAPITGVEIPLALAMHADTGGESQLQTADTTPPGFVLTGAMKLFGELDAERYIFQGNASPDGKSEMITTKERTLTLDQLLHSTGINWGDIQLLNPSVSHYPQKNDAGRGPGLWLDAIINFNDALAEAGHDLKELFGQASDQMKVSASLGGFTSWGDALKGPSDFAFDASLTGITATLGKHIAFTSLDVVVQASFGSDAGATGKQVHDWTYILSGALSLTTPGSLTPLSLDYRLTREKSLYSLDMHLHESHTWDNAMGVVGMHLFDVRFSTKFDAAATGGSHAFSLIATLKVDSLDVPVSGTYDDDKWSLHASLNNVTWAQLDDLYKDMFGSPLHSFDHNLSFQDLQLDVSSESKDLVLQGSMAVDDWPQAHGKITISSKGFHVEASVTRATFGHATIEDAVLDIFVGKQGDVDPDPKKPGTACSFTMTGTLETLGMKLDAMVYLDKDSDRSLIWAMYAKCAGHVQLSQVFSLGSRSDLDFVLENIAVVAANTDKLGANMPSNLEYEVKPGFQLFAKIDTPRALAKTLRSQPSTLIVNVDLTGDAKTVDFIFGTPQAITLKPGVSAPTIKAGIAFEEIPSLFIKADLDVVLDNQPDPLVFELTLNADIMKATATAELTTDWVNPLGISPKIKVLSPVSIGVEIIYASEIYPSGLSFQGGMQIGETVIHAAFDVTDNPKEGVILLEAEHLGIKDLISFASLIVDHALPQPSSDFLYFQDLELGLSTGASIASTYYPPGVTFAAAMTLFGKAATIKAQVVKSPPSVSASGSIESFSLGPLSVTGHADKDLAVAFDFGTEKQHASIDGEIKLWELDVAVTIIADLVPLDLNFNAKLAFSDVLDFELIARIDGEVKSLKDLGHCDFTFEADLEQHILDYFMAHANSYILAAKKASDEGCELAKAKLAQTQKDFDDVISKKQAELDATKAAWDKQNAATVSAADAKRAKVKDDEARMRQEIDDAKKKLDAFIDTLEKKADKVRLEAKQEIDKAEKALNDEKARIDTDVDAKVHKLQEAQEALSHSFGNADKGLENAQAKVQAAQRDMDSLNRDINNTKNDLSHANFFSKAKYALKLAGLTVEKGAKEAALGVANGILSAARAIVDGPAYKLAHGAVSVAEEALEIAKKAGDGALNGLRGGLDEVQKVQNGLIQAAEHELEEAKKECDESKLWDAAKKTLDTFLEVKAALIAEADKAVEALKACAEKLAYSAALAGLAVARAGTKEIDLAKHAVSLVEEGMDGIAHLGTWMVQHVGNIFNIHSIKLSGKLGESMAGKPLMAAVEGEFADKHISFDVSFVPGKAEEMMKEAFVVIMEDVKKDLSNYVKSVL